jgi:hypothetical protein
MTQQPKTHWKKLFNPDYLGAYSFQPGEEKTLTISTVVTEIVTGPDGKKEECAVITWQEKDKPMILNATNAKTITKVLKSPHIDDWAGKRIVLGVEMVAAFGDRVEAIRVQKKQPEQIKIPACAKCGQIITATGEFTVKQIVAAGMNRFGTPVCMDCVQAAKEVQPEPEVKDAD